MNKDKKFDISFYFLDDLMICQQTIYFYLFSFKVIQIVVLIKTDFCCIYLQKKSHLSPTSLDKIKLIFYISEGYVYTTRTFCTSNRMVRVKLMVNLTSGNYGAL